MSERYRPEWQLQKAHCYSFLLQVSPPVFKNNANSVNEPQNISSSEKFENFRLIHLNDFNIWTKSWRLPKMKDPI